MTRRRASAIELIGLVLLAYVPFLISSPGRVSADTKQYLYLDPGRFLARAPYLWDPHIGAGTVPHQHIGYLFPMGPWFWVMEQLGVPDWVAQRLWLGTISLAAALGARWLLNQLGVGRAGALAGALVYMLTPYQLAFTARISVLLLPWAALPWLIGLTMRATRRGGWRDPALFALVAMGAGSVNASALLLVLIGPAVWLLLECASSRRAAAAALGAGVRIAVLSALACAWWVAGIGLQGRYGLPILDLTEKLHTTTGASSPDDVLRGIGNWFFFGVDRLGYSIDQAGDFASDRPTLVATFAIPAAGLAAAILLRWRHRALFVLLLVVGTVVAVGAWPLDDLSPYGALWEDLASGTSAFGALRNTARAVPLVLLGLAGLLAATVGALPARRQVAGATAVALLAVGGLLPVWRTGFLSDRLDRPEDVPTYWIEAAREMDRGGTATRVLEVPGSNFAAYSWGNAVDPITPGLIDRPYVAREVLPYGTPPSINLLDALDRRMQKGTFEPASLAPIARLLGVGTVALRADLQNERFGTRSPALLWGQLAEPLAPGLREPRRFGPPVGASPAVALFDVADQVPIVRVSPAREPVVLEGDGDGVVDAAAAGLLDGTGLVLHADALDEGALGQALQDGADLVLTDSNRRRIQSWFYSLRDTRGPTERAGQTLVDPNGYDVRVDPYGAHGDDGRTVVEHEGGQVDATLDGGPDRPEDRAVHAFDGDAQTAWRVGGAVVGQRVVLRADTPFSTDAIEILQAPAPDRSLTSVRVRVDGGDAVDVALEQESLTGGQRVPLAVNMATQLEIELVGTTAATGGAIGLAEVRAGQRAVLEVVRVPVDLTRRAGAGAAGRSLDMVFTRLRGDPADATRQDEELAITRRFELGSARSFALTGDARALGEQGCRGDLVSVDGAPVLARVIDGVLASCGDVRLEPGSHLLRTASAASGVVIDRLVLSSSPSGDAAPVAARGAPRRSAGATVRVDGDAPDELDLTVDSDGEPFWLVLGQSHSDGWDAEALGRTLGPPQLVDGYANGWRIDPDEPGSFAVELRWTPQRLVWVALGVSGLTVLACLAILAITGARRRRLPAQDADPSLRPIADEQAATTWPARAAAGLAVGAVTALVAPVWVAASASVLMVAGLVVPRTRLAWAVLAPGALLLARADHRPTLAWLAVALVAADVAATWWEQRGAISAT